MKLTNREISIIIGLLAKAVKDEIDKKEPNYDLVAYYNNVQLKLELMKEFIEKV